MSAAPSPSPGAGGRAAVLAGVALGLYPPAWRARYQDEVLLMLDDSGADVRTAASLAWHALPAWVCPPRQLHDRPARMQASLATVLLAWTFLAGLAAVFLWLAQAQRSSQLLTLARHPVIQWSYWLFDGAVLVSVLAMVGGCLPLWLLMLRSTLRTRRPREMTWLLAPVIVPALYLAAAGFLRHTGVQGRPQPVMPWQSKSIIDMANGMVGPRWFVLLVLAGFAAAAISAAGPGLALRRLRPRGPATTLAVRAAGCAAATMALAGAAGAVAVTGLYNWAPAYAGYHQSWQLAIYLPSVVLSAAVAIVSAGRGLRAARSATAA